jgi:hypothetical protein
MRRHDHERRGAVMDELFSWQRGTTVDPSSLEVDQWRRFVGLLLLLVQSGRIDAADGVALVEALGHPPDVARGRSVLFDIVRRHEPDSCATESR